MPISPLFQFLSRHFTSLSQSTSTSPDLSSFSLSSSPSSSSFPSSLHDLSLVDSSPSSSTSVVDFHLSFPSGPTIEGFLAVISLAAGLLLCFAGKRLFRPLLWLFAFLFAGGLIYYTLIVNSNFSHLTCFLIAASISLIIGAIVGFLVSFCMFLCGAAVGYIFWIGFLTFFPQSLITAPGGMYAILSIIMLICGTLAVVYEQFLLILITPILGSFLFAQGLDFFTHFNLNAMSVMHGDVNCSDSKCVGFNALFLMLAVSGFGFQWFGWKRNQHKTKRSLASTAPAPYLYT